jgi:type VI secretion system protein ImpL
MVSDKPQYNVLGAVASASASPILLLVKEVEAETRLTREFEGLEGMTPDALAGGGGETAGAVQDAVTQRMRNRSSGVQRICLTP